jgi:hypothetical protein
MVLDYDDLLLFWAQMMEEPALARLVGQRFDHVLVDEYQDTNALQAQILLRMKPHGRGLAVVGDDAQLIYSFSSRDSAEYSGFPKAVYAARARREARAELPLDATDTGGVQRDDRAGDPGLPQATRFQQTIGRAPAACRSGR